MGHVRLAMMMGLRLFGVKHEAVGGPDRQGGVEDEHRDRERNERAPHGW
jgi:hypothetical protein